MTKIKGYKAFSNDFFIDNYELNKEYFAMGDIKYNKNGFHFCENLEDVLRYYDGFDENTIICEVEGYGQIDTYNDYYNDYYFMYAVSNMKILKVLTREEIIDIIIKKSVPSVMRFISLYKLDESEKKIILDNFKEQVIKDYIDYYQNDKKDVFERKRK